MSTRNLLILGGVAAAIGWTAGADGAAAHNTSCQHTHLGPIHVHCATRPPNAESCSSGGKNGYCLTKFRDSSWDCYCITEDLKPKKTVIGDFVKPEAALDEESPPVEPGGLSEPLILEFDRELFDLGNRLELLRRRLNAPQ